MEAKKFLIVFFLFLLGNQTYAQEIVNAGIKGNSTEDLLKRLEKDVLDKNPDVVLLMVGTNDMLNTKKLLSYKAYESNLDTITETLIRKNIKVFLVSPPPVDTVYLFERHDKKLFEQKPNKKLDTVSRIMQRVASKNKLGFVDVRKVFQEKGIPKHNLGHYIKNENNSSKRDGVHPTAKGYHLISEIIFDALKTEEWFHKNLSILCFGDSITYGKGVKGEGTTNGETYPAYLCKLLDAY